jgi:hypothetical protein
MNERYKKRTENDEYLWDRSGEPDPQILGLEHVLERFRATNLVPPAFPVTDAAPHRSSLWQAIASKVWTPRFAAATLTLTAITIAFVLAFREPTPRDNNGWRIELAEAQSDISPDTGAPRKEAWLQIGEAFETNSASRASIAVADIGRLEVAPSSRLRLLESAGSRKRVALDHGTIQATIWAPPGEFVLDTASAVAVDLGCMYTLRVDETGSGLLRTTLGWVGFRKGDHESFIPAGAAVATYAQTGPGLPYFEDATNAFRSGVSQFDSAEEPSAQRAAAMQVILREARARDALTLWHLLTRVSESDRPIVYGRLTALVPPPPGVTRDGILHLNRTMLDSWWNALDLGDIGLWRHFEQSWTDPANHNQPQPK